MVFSCNSRCAFVKIKRNKSDKLNNRNSGETDRHSQLPAISGTPLFMNYNSVLNIFLVLPIQQEKACKQEDRLIAKLQELDMDTNLVGVLRRQAIVLLDGGPTSGLGLGVHRDSIPMHTFARFLFVALLDYYPDLAYEVGLRAMR